MSIDGSGYHVYNASNIENQEPPEKTLKQLLGKSLYELSAKELEMLEKPETREILLGGRYTIVLTFWERLYMAGHYAGFAMPTARINIIPKWRPIISADFGEIIGWGEGQTLEAAEQTMNVTEKLDTKMLEGWIKKGLTKDWVEKQLFTYNKNILKGGLKLKNVNLLPRKALMEKILKLWPKPIWETLKEFFHIK